MRCFSETPVTPLRPSDSALRRPSTLVRAAQAGQAGWHRSRDLPRLLRRDSAPPPPVAIRMLRVDEARHESARRAGRADYDLRRHVMLLIALVAEMTEARVAQPARRCVSVPGTPRPERHAG